MREILFRGKRIDNGEWVEATGINKLIINLTGEEQWFINSRLDSSVNFNEQGHLFHLIAVEECVAYRIDPETLGQYTGLTDKNGKKIFEGDILESPIGRKAIVSFGTYKPWSTKDSDDFECWKLTLMANNTGETKLECGLGKHCVEYMRLIGNIHDNPELLEGEENAAD